MTSRKGTLGSLLLSSIHPGFYYPSQSDHGKSLILIVNSHRLSNTVTQSKGIHYKDKTYSNNFKKKRYKSAEKKLEDYWNKLVASVLSAGQRL